MSEPLSRFAVNSFSKRVCVNSSARPRFAAPGLTGHFVTYGGPDGDLELPDSFVVIDVETSGFNPANGDRVVEISAVRTDGKGNVEATFSSLVNPEDGNVGATFIHGITSEMVADAPTFRQLVPQLADFMSDAVFVAHNAFFDENFIFAEANKAGWVLQPMPGLCTFWLAQHSLAKDAITPNFKLSTIADAFGVTNQLAHAALGDALVVVDLLPHLFKASGPIRYYSATSQQVADGERVQPKDRALS